MGLSMRAIAACGAVWVATGCVVTEPADGALSGPAEPVSFRGYTSLPKQKVELQALSPAGDFKTFVRTRASREPLVLDDGSRLYPWRAESVVPHWQGTGCEQTAEVRALGTLGGRSAPLFAFDEAGAECLQSALDDGTPLAAAVAACGESLGGVITLHAGSTSWTGDVVLTTQAEADALACVSRIEGSLTVQPAEAVIQLPALQEVTGEVLIEVEDTTPGSFSVAEVVELSMLDTIGGALRFHHVGGDYGSDVQLGLPSLTSLSGDLELVLSSFNGYNEGLQALQQVGGDLTLEAAGDLYPLSLLEALTHVTGNVFVQTNAGSSGGVLNGLVHVGGDLQIQSLGFLNANAFTGLQTVDGDLQLLNTYANASRLPALAAVGGALHVQGVAGASVPPGVTFGSAGLSLGAFELRDAPYLTVPLAPAAVVAPAGAMTFEDNPHLCQADVDTFVSGQQAAGWMGLLTVSGNTGGCVP